MANTVEGVDMAKRTCKVEGCESVSYVSGECREHRPRCKIDGCDKPERARGVCGAHYEQWRNNPDGAVQPNDLVTPPERFWPKVDKTETCWLWVGTVNAKGYGMFGLAGRLVPAHRFAYELLVEPIPDGLQIDHVNGHERTAENTYIHPTRGIPVCRVCSRAAGRRHLRRKR